MRTLNHSDVARVFNLAFVDHKVVMNGGHARTAIRILVFGSQKYIIRKTMRRAHCTKLRIGALLVNVDDGSKIMGISIRHPHERKWIERDSRPWKLKPSRWNCCSRKRQACCFNRVRTTSMPQPTGWTSV